MRLTNEEATKVYRLYVNNSGAYEGGDDFPLCGACIEAENLWEDVYGSAIHGESCCNGDKCCSREVTK